MQVLISAFTAIPRDFTDTANAALDAKSLPLHEDEWHEHLSEYFNEAPYPDSHPLSEIAEEVSNFLYYYEHQPTDDAEVLKQISLAQKLSALVDAGIEHGCDRIGIAG